MRGSCVLITPGHCASSLAMHRLREEGYEVGPPGQVDARHPLGHYDWMDFLAPQISGTWEDYFAAVDAQGPGPYAFKLQNGLIRWEVKAILALPSPHRVIVLDRECFNKITTRIGAGATQWVWEWARATMRVLPELCAQGIPVEFWTKEDLCEDRSAGTD